MTRYRHAFISLHQSQACINLTFALSQSHDCARPGLLGGPVCKLQTELRQCSLHAGTPVHRDNGGIPANVFTMNLADRIKLAKGIRKLPPAAYTMSGVHAHTSHRTPSPALLCPDALSHIAPRSPQALVPTTLHCALPCTRLAALHACSCRQEGLCEAAGQGHQAAVLHLRYQGHCRG